MFCAVLGLLVILQTALALPEVCTNSFWTCSEAQSGHKKCLQSYTIYVDEVVECKWSATDWCWRYFNIDNCRNKLISGEQATCKDINGVVQCVCSSACSQGELRCYNRYFVSPAGPDEIQVCDSDGCGWKTKTTCATGQRCENLQCVDKPCPYCCPTSKTCSAPDTGTGCTAGTCCAGEYHCKTPTSCKATGETCTSSSECCSGLTCLSSGKCGTTTSCKSTGQSCTSNTECCSGLECQSGTCKVKSTTCKNADESCSVSSDCCKGLYCASGTCKVNPTCLSELQIISCQYAYDNNNCDKLDELGLVKKADCCSCLGMCCSGNTVSLDEFKAVLIKSIQSYFSLNPVLTKDELKDMIYAYLATPNTVSIVDLNVIGHYSGKKLLDTYNKAKGITPSQDCTIAGGACKPNACSTYNNCNTVQATCVTGSCCSGSCTSTCTPSCTGKCGGVSDGCGGVCSASCGPLGSKTNPIKINKPTTQVYDGYIPENSPDGSRGSLTIPAGAKIYFEVDPLETTGRSVIGFGLSVKFFSGAGKVCELTKNKTTGIYSSESCRRYTSLIKTITPNEVDNTKFLFAIDNTGVGTAAYDEIWATINPYVGSGLPPPSGPLGSITNPYKLNTPTPNYPGEGGYAGHYTTAEASLREGLLSVPPGPPGTKVYFEVDPFSTTGISIGAFGFTVLTYNNWYIHCKGLHQDKITGIITGNEVCEESGDGARDLVYDNGRPYNVEIDNTRFLYAIENSLNNVATGMLRIYAEMTPVPQP